MAYNYNMSGIQQNQQAQQAPNASLFSQTNVQPLFPQPQGNVYNINSTLEVANVPVGAGISVALCLPENVMYIKTMQNGNPLFYPYKITPYTNETGTQKEDGVQEENDTIQTQLQQFDSKINQMEEQINLIKESLNKNVSQKSIKGSDWAL